jgi:hypothetical protein
VDYDADHADAAFRRSERKEEKLAFTIAPASPAFANFAVLYQIDPNLSIA